jgi:hypothetical protein
MMNNTRQPQQPGRGWSTSTSYAPGAGRSGMTLGNGVTPVGAPPPAAGNNNFTLGGGE